MWQVFSVVRYNFRGFFKNPKVILTLLLGIVLCYLLSTRIMVVIEGYGTPVQLAEPFLWTFGDAASILLSSILLLLLFSDMPMMSSATPYYLHRTTKKKWLLGQMAYVICVVAVYTFSLFITTAILCMKNSYIGNQWSETAAMLAYSKLGVDLNIPSTVKVMESITPYECMFGVICLLFFYILCLSFLVLAGNLLGRNKGMVAGLFFSLYGFLLEPKVLADIFHINKYEMYKINLMIGWISPLSHVTYAKHNFGYDKMPTIGESYLVFAIFMVFLTGISIKALKGYRFRFLGEKS